MKIVLLTIMLLSSSYALATNTREAVKVCLEEARLAFPRNDEIVSRCYGMALPFYDSPDLLEKATYLEALTPYIFSSGDERSYVSLSVRLTHYYNLYLRPQITRSSVFQLKDADLIELAHAVNLVRAYTNLTSIEPVTLSETLLIFGELEGRKLATEDHAYDLYSTLINYGKWIEAIFLLKSWPMLESIPLPSPVLDEVIGKGELGYYVVSPDMQTMTLRKLEYNKGPRILIYGNCHFAFDAFKILDEAGMSPIIQEFPAFEIHRIHLNGAWVEKGFNLMMSPSFEFLRDGKSRYRFTGVKNVLSQFCEGLRSMGLELPSACFQKTL